MCSGLRCWSVLLNVSCSSCVQAQVLVRPLECSVLMCSGSGAQVLVRPLECSSCVQAQVLVRPLECCSSCVQAQVLVRPLECSSCVQGPGSAVSNLLQMMYTHSCMSRMKTQLQPPAPRLLQSEGGAVQVYERSIYSDRYIFALNSFELGSINATEWAIYQDWHSLLVEEFGQRVALEGIIYLRPPTEEQEVQQDYLEKLHVQHERWLLDKSTEVHSESLRAAPVLMLDASVEFKSDPRVQHDYITKVRRHEEHLQSQ
uniref:Deoxyguanosine kinase n=1 Tax=Neogobius melanostomus TaxID=47308 RepID=A0A8C6SNB2_9GOBI